VAITTLGCKVNQYESASVVSEFANGGVEVVPFSEAADIYIINTCAVTAKAAAQSRQCIRRALRANPEARFVVTGCYAQVASQEILAMTKQPICLVGNANKHRLAELALQPGSCDPATNMGAIGEAKEICPLPVRRYSDRTRAHIKVQDGCNNFCSYCIVPYARGRSRSLSVDKVLEQAAVFVEEGYRELVLTGIHLGNYGYDFTPPVALSFLVKRLLLEFPTTRLRISSLEPTEISRDLLDLMASSETVMPHLHIPLQSGDNGILRKMNRHYTSEEFAAIVWESVKRLPNIAIGVDVLVGFPGEDEAAFKRTELLLEDLPLAYLHVFPYSRRPGTVAAGMPEQISKQVKEERVALLRELDHKKRNIFYGRFLGQTCRVLVENGRNSFQLLKGFSEQYIPVYFAGSAELVNSVVDVKVERLVDRNVFGRIVAN